MDSPNSDEDSDTSTKNKVTPTNSEENMTFCLEELCSDDEVYTFQGPENFDDLSLLEKKLNLKYSSEAGHQNEIEYYLFKSGKKNLTLAVPSQKSGSGSLINLNCKGHIVIKKNLPASPSLGNQILDDNEYEIPTAKKEKMRHPLLGVDWKTHLDIADSAIMKSQFKNKKSESSKRKKKHKEKSTSKRSKEIY